MTEALGPEPMSRRGMLACLAATLAGGAVLSACAPLARPGPVRAFDAAAGRPLGIQLYMLGDEPYRDLPGTFAKLAEMGYREIEVPQVAKRQVPAIASTASAAGLAVGSVHLNTGRLASSASLSLDNDVAAIADALGQLGAKLAVVPMTPLPKSAKLGGTAPFAETLNAAIAAEGADYWLRLAELLNERGTALAAHGIGVGYHNHNMEFAPLGDTTGWDILVKHTDPSIVHFEVDIGWVRTAGLDPAEFIRKLGRRARQLHLKDVASGVTPNFALQTSPTVVGTGVVDWPSVLRAAREAGVEHAYVEQEPPFTIARMEAARQSAAFLSALNI